MNIERAKDEIRRTLRAYRKTLPDGSLRFPVEKQRPLLMIGPPGIGKTAIMKQIAEETGEGLVAYSMTHHTRQSAIGLPMIEKRVFDGTEQSVTEYTMSEIVASLYEYMELTGKKQGILFLDEINCVSETLTPVILQLLQNKTFGTHALPEGWVIVAAGNPPEYNRAVRELDMATVDRVKNLDIEPDLAVWQAYAEKKNVHPSIRTYLTVYPEHFYVIREVDREQVFVTARGWEDLSLMIDACEEDNEAVDEEMIREYLRDPQVAHSFSGFYSLFHTFSLADTETENPDFCGMLLKNRDRLSMFSEVHCLSLSSMLFRRLQAEAHAINERKRITDRLRERAKEAFFGTKENLRSDAAVTAWFVREAEEIAKKQKVGRLSPAEAALEKRVLLALEEVLRGQIANECGDEAFADAVETLCDANTAEAAEAGGRWRESEKQAEEVLSACMAGETALRYLLADLKNDDDTKLLMNP